MCTAVIFEYVFSIWLYMRSTAHDITYNKDRGINVQLIFGSTPIDHIHRSRIVTVKRMQLQRNRTVA
jgi:hypothetical protein